MVDIPGFYLPTWLCILVPVLLLLYRLLTANFGYFTEMGIRGPKPAPLVGNLLQFKEGVLNFDQKMKKEYGNLVGTFSGSRPMLVVHDLDMIRQILIKEFTCFTNKMVRGHSTYPVRMIMNNLESDHWRHVRTTTTPSFTGAKLRRMNAALNKCAKTFIHHLGKECEKGESFEMKYESSKFMMDAVASCAFGLDINSHDNSESEFVKRGRQIMGFKFSMLSPKVLLFFIAPKLFKALKMNFLSADAINFFSNATDHALSSEQDEKDACDILRMLRQFDRGDHKPGDEKTNPDLILSPLGHVYSKTGLTHEEILGMALAFFSAGFETVAGTMAFVCYNLACHPEQQERVFAEVSSVMAGKTEADYDTLKQMHFLQMCVDETLRMYPPATRLDRQCGQDVDIGGVRMREGLIIVIPAFAIHMDPALYPQPEKFIPDRFSAEEKTKRHPMAYLPFGQGPRNCIGFRLALMQIKMALVHVITNFRLLTCDKTEFPIKLHPFMAKAVNGVHLKIERR